MDHQTEQIVLLKSINYFNISRFSEWIQDKNGESIGISYFDDQYDAYQTADWNTDSISESMFNNLDPFSIQAILNTTAAKYSNEIAKKVSLTFDLFRNMRKCFERNYQLNLM